MCGWKCDSQTKTKKENQFWKISICVKKKKKYFCPRKKGTLFSLKKKCKYNGGDENCVPIIIVISSIYWDYNQITNDDMKDRTGQGRTIDLGKMTNIKKKVITTSK